MSRQNAAHPSSLADMTRPHRPLARSAFASLLLAAAGTAAAHTDTGAAGGFVSGFTHPLVGIDHLLAMVAVGVWGAVLRAPLIWALPVVFPLLMVVGGVVGILGIGLPGVEVGIALSVLLLGLAIAAAWRAPVAAAIAIVALFGVLHGHAHGTELPDSVSPAAYAAGFVVSTGLLHLSGILLGSLDRLPRGLVILRCIGALMGVAGGWMLVGRLL
jgi:urease accessory protein